MKIKSIHLEKFKRFTDLTIRSIPQDAKLLVLVGPNGCGKSSLFDAFKTWHLIKAYSNGVDNDYCKKDKNDQRQGYQLVNIDFYESINDFSQNQYKEFFYLRTAYRNSPSISVRALQTIPSPLLRADNKMMIQNDATVDENYQRLVSVTFTEFFDKKNDDKRVVSLRDELISKIREPLHDLFPDLLLTGLGLVTDKAEFYFNKGTTQKYGYEKLSGGEKAVFDLLLDFVIKTQYYKNTVFCIDEPETHIHTSLQAKLLSKLFDITPDNSQLWIATHSFGMMKEAKSLSESHPGEVAFLNFDGYDFDDSVTIEPTKCDNVLWNKMLEITLDDFAPFMAPETIVFCEGTTQGKKRKDFDARCYTAIFETLHPGTMFFSLGDCESVEREQQIIDFMSRISKDSKIIKMVDRDDRSPEEIADLKSKGVKVLSRRHLEAFLLDDEVLKKWCVSVGKPEFEDEILSIKEQALKESIARGNAPDDYKSAANDICTKGKKILGVTGCGNTGDMIMRDTLAKLVTSDMAVYQELEIDIFG
jgi:predicted ATPase